MDIEQTETFKKTTNAGIDFERIEKEHRAEMAHQKEVKNLLNQFSQYQKPELYILAEILLELRKQNGK